MEKKTNIRLLIFVFTLLLPHLALAQQLSFTLDGKNYFKENNRLDLHVAATTSNTSWTDNYVTIANSKFANYKYYYRVTTVDDDFESAVSNEVNCSSNSMWKINDATNNVKMIYEYNLANNYPNPFNPTTIIKYSISNAAADLGQRVVIKVFNIL
jgi:hypothetical protein